MHRGAEVDMWSAAQVPPNKALIKLLGHLFAHLKTLDRDTRSNRRDKARLDRVHRFIDHAGQQPTPTRVYRRDRAAISRREQDRHAVGGEDARHLIRLTQQHRVRIARIKGTVPFTWNMHRVAVDLPDADPFAVGEVQSLGDGEVVAVAGAEAVGDV